jgi:hypothetical protein
MTESNSPMESEVNTEEQIPNPINSTIIEVLETTNLNQLNNESITESNSPMESEIKTEKQITNSINAAFDSVNLINSIVSKSFEANKEKTIKVNVEHLVLMLSKDWFANGLTEEQKSQINTCIAVGNSYVSQ